MIGLGQTALAATYETFDPSNGNGTTPYAINAHGVVSGSYDARGVVGFLRAADGTISTYSVPGAQMTFGTSINAGGTVAGSYRLADNKDHGFIRSPDGTLTTFDVPGADETTVKGINKYGVVTGYATVATLSIGFLRTRDGTITTFQVPGETAGTLAEDINVENEITGEYCCVFHGSKAVSKGFIRHADGRIVKFLPPDTRATSPLSIIPNHTVAGYYIDPNDNTHGFFRANGNITTLDVPHGSQTQPTAMNINGVMTGVYYDGYDARGFLYGIKSGKFAKFDVPGGNSTIPMSINRKGEITGTYIAVGIYRGFVRIP